MKPVLALLLITLASPVSADSQPYAGQDARAIKALSPERTAGLRAGAGLGYAKAAELNGWPGPLHVLELSNALDLSTAQVERIEAIRQDMLAEAKALGEAFIGAEAALETLFAENTPDEEAVLKATARIGVIEAQLRTVHLAAHLDTKPALTRHQRMIYARARGYGQNGGHNGHAGHGNH